MGPFSVILKISPKVRCELYWAGINSGPVCTCPDSDQDRSGSQANLCEGQPHSGSLCILFLFPAGLGILNTRLYPRPIPGVILCPSSSWSWTCWTICREIAAAAPSIHLQTQSCHSFSSACCCESRITILFQPNYQIHK